MDTFLFTSILLLLFTSGSCVTITALTFVKILRQEIESKKLLLALIEKIKRDKKQDDTRKV